MALPRLCDLHTHTRWSDGRATPRQLLERSRALGIGIAISDHNVIEGALEAWDEDPDRVVPGIEITTLERVHLLVWFRNGRDLASFFARAVAPYRPRGATPTTVLPRPAEALLDAARRYDHVSAAAHPFAAAKNGWASARAAYAYLDSLVSELSAVEVLNGEEVDGANARAAALAAERGLGRTAGSDAHVLGELGSVCVIAPDDLFESVRAGAVEIVDRRLGGDWRRMLAHSAKLPYFAGLPALRLFRLARGADGHGPRTAEELAALAEQAGLDPHEPASASG